jgi:NTE family protein
MATFQQHKLIRPFDLPPAVRRLARDAFAESPRNRVAFVLQGGGSLAAGQLGMLRALTEAGVHPDLVIGASAGAINAVAFRADPSLDGLARLQALWTGLHRRQIAPISSRRLVPAAWAHGAGVLADSGLRRLLRSHLPIRDLEHTMIPVHVVATELETTQPVVLSTGDAVTAVLASSAFPGLYPPVTIGGRPFIDGGVTADVPILQAEALGAQVSYLLPAATVDTAHLYGRGPLTLGYAALGMLLDGIANRDIAMAIGQVHVLPTVPAKTNNPFDFRDTADLIRAGYDATSAWLDSHTHKTHATPAP